MFVIESAATKRSFRRFLGTPGKTDTCVQKHIQTCVFLSPGASEASVKSHPEQKPPARRPPPPPGSPGACGSGWSRPTWSGWAWAWSSRRCGWVRNGGILPTAYATQTRTELSGSNTFPFISHVLFPHVFELNPVVMPIKRPLMKSKTSVLKETRRPKYKRSLLEVLHRLVRVCSSPPWLNREGNKTHVTVSGWSPH